MEVVKDFSQFIEEKNEHLVMFTKAIAKVHGPQHPEIIEVRVIYEGINEKLDNDKMLIYQKNPRKYVN